LSFLLVDEQTAQLQPIIGTPLLVPVPKKVIESEEFCTNQIYIKKQSKNYLLKF
jgi:hypothetical protein